MTDAEAQKIAAKRLKQCAEDFLVSLKESHDWALSGDERHPSETILLAYLMTAVDGYNRVELHCGERATRPKKGFGTVLGYRVPLGQTVADFVLECRSGQHSRELAISIDRERPNVRTAKKQRDEAALAAVCSSVMIFSSEEICADPEGCTERIESRLGDLIEEAMMDDGIPVRPSSHAS